MQYHFYVHIEFRILRFYLAYYRPGLEALIRPPRESFDFFELIGGIIRYLFFFALSPPYLQRVGTTTANHQYNEV